MPVLSVLAAWLLSAAAAAAHAQPAPAVAELVADHSAVRPGQEFTVGVLIVMRPNWHVYWKYPGEAGLATAVTFAAPRVTFSGLRWPTPTTFDQGDGRPGFGYTDTVLLTAKATVPPDAKVGQTIALTAEAEWLCCQSECLPGSKKMTLRLTVAEAPVRTYQKLFDEWEQRLPAKADASTPKVDVNVEGKAVTIAAPAGVEVYPAPPSGVRLSKLRVEEGKLRFELAGAGRGPTTIPAIVVSGGRAYETELSLK